MIVLFRIVIDPLGVLRFSRVLYVLDLAENISLRRITSAYVSFNFNLHVL